jgi:hypothetical protein
VASLLAYDEHGVVIATLDGIWSGADPVDLEGHEASGGKLRRYWQVSGAAGSGTWPEHLGADAHRFRVELDPAAPQRIVALVDIATGERRERSALEPGGDRGGSGSPLRPI